LKFPKPTAPAIFGRDDSAFEEGARTFSQQDAVLYRLVCVAEIVNVHDWLAAHKQLG
jgi:hypothetical protein